jgi:hypothetical protein
MKLLKGLGIGLCLTVLCLLVAPKTKAYGLDSQTVVTFVVPVQVPGLSGQTLPAGTYIFKAVDSSPDRDIIQISSQDGTHVFTTFLGVPNSHLKASDLMVTMFGNRPAADPQALETWFCPGHASGDQIVYEKPIAIQLAKEANEPVLSTSVVLANSSVETLKTAPIEGVNPSGETVAITQVFDAPTTVAVASPPAVAPEAAPAPTVTPEPTAAPASVAETAPTVTAQNTVVAVMPTTASVPPATEPTATAAPTATVRPTMPAAPELATARLPNTASLLPLIGLVGLLMLGAGFLLTNLLKRRA